MADELYENLRRLIDELKEFAGLEQQQIADSIGTSPTTISRFLSGNQETLPFDKGRAIETLHEEHGELIKNKKLEKMRALEASLQGSAQ